MRILLYNYVFLVFLRENFKVFFRLLLKFIEISLKASTKFKEFAVSMRVSNKIIQDKNTDLHYTNESIHEQK